MIAIGVDVGQGGVRAAAVGGPAVEDSRGFWDAPMPELVLAAIRSLAAPSDVAVGVGVTGPTDVGPAVAAELRSAGYRGVLRIASDAVTAHLGVFSGGEGVVVAAGTGAVVLGSGPRGLALVDGLGHELGDRGSGYWIGRASVRRALALAEAGEDDALVGALVARWGDVEGFAARWRAAPPSVREVASFAAVTAELAREGSPGAADVWRAGGAELAASASLAVRRSGARRVALTGGLLAAGELLTGPIGDGLPDGVALVAGEGGPLDGALLLARSSSTPFDELAIREVLL